MATKKKIGRHALWFLPLLIVPVAGYFALPLWENDYVVALCGIFVMGYSIFLATHLNRRYDEVQIASQRFAMAKGLTIGTFVGMVVMVFPPSMNALADLVHTVAVARDAPEDDVRLGIFFGYLMLVILQFVGIVAASIWWWSGRLGSSD